MGKPRPWRGALALLACALAVEVAIAVLVGPRGRELVDTQRRELAPREGQVLVLGDSSSRDGISRSLLSQLLGRPVGKAWFPGSQSPIGVSLVLEERLAADPPPAAVILMFSAYGMRDEINQNYYVRHFARPGEVLELRRAGVIGTKDALDILLSLYLPSLRNRSQLRELIKFKAWKRRSPWTAHRRSASVPQYSLRARRVAFVRTLRSVRKILRTLPFPPPAHSRFFIEKAVRLARERGIPVFLAPGPLYEGAFITAREKAFFRAGETFLRELAEAEGATLLLPATEIFRIGEMNNNHAHLNATGRRRMTRIIFDRLCGGERPLFPEGCPGETTAPTLP